MAVPGSFLWRNVLKQRLQIQTNRRRCFTNAKIANKASWLPPLLIFLVCKLARVMMKSPYDKLNGTATTNQVIQDFTVIYIDTV